MIEKILYDYLKNRIDVPVFMEFPEEPEETMIVIEKTGSNLDDHVYSAVIAIQSYSKTLYETAKLNEKIIDVMLNSIEIDKICKCDINSDYNFPDLDRKRYRYQAVFDITYLK